MYVAVGLGLELGGSGFSPNRFSGLRLMRLSVNTRLFRSLDLMNIQAKLVSLDSLD